jgi:hypothetical protein
MSTPLSVDLGRLARPVSEAPYESVRLALLDRLILAEAAGSLDHAAWEASFAEAVVALRQDVLAMATEAVQAAARRSRLPAGRVRAALPDEETAESLEQRLLACGMPLERLAESATDLQGRRARGTALESAWDSAVALALAESRRWQRQATELAAWRRPLRPLLGFLGGLTLVMALVSAWLGGQLAAPSWFMPLHRAFWSLPWP